MLVSALPMVFLNAAAIYARRTFTLRTVYINAAVNYRSGEEGRMTRRSKLEAATRARARKIIAIDGRRSWEWRFNFSSRHFSNNFLIKRRIFISKEQKRSGEGGGDNNRSASTRLTRWSVKVRKSSAHLASIALVKRPGSADHHPRRRKIKTRLQQP